MDLDVGATAATLDPMVGRIATPQALVFEDVYERHYSDVLRYALVLTRSRTEAEDVAAEAFARAWRAWSKGRDPDGPPLPWLLAITRNVAMDLWRRTRRALAVNVAVRRAEEVQEVESLVWLEQLCRILPARQTEAIVLRYHRDLADADIGRLMGLSESGVRSLVARAIATLRQHPEVWS